MKKQLIRGKRVLIPGKDRVKGSVLLPDGTLKSVYDAAHQHKKRGKKVKTSYASTPRFRGDLKASFDGAYKGDQRELKRFTDLVWTALKQPDAPMYNVALDCGFSESAARSLAARFCGARVEGVGAAAAYRTDLRGAELVEKLRENVSVFATSVTPAVVDEMNGRDLALAFGIHFDKLQLAEGHPTEIIDHRHRLELEETAAELFEEIQRRKALRGPIVDIEAKEVGS